MPLTRHPSITDAQAETVRAIDVRCRGPISAEAQARKDALLAEGKLDEARAVDAAERPGCHQDINELVLSEPLDGKPHSAPCPQCGRTVNWTAPRFD